MRFKQLLERKGLTWIDIVKASFAMGFLGLFVVIMIIGAVGAAIS